MPSPTAVVATTNALCGTDITALSFDINYAGPYALIDVAFASSPPPPSEIEIERYLQNGQTEPYTTLSNVVGRVRVDLHFNTKYRVRARAGSCPWSAWVDQQVGPANPCGGCTDPLPPPPPPAPQPPKEDDPDCEHEDHDDHDKDERWWSMQAPEGCETFARRRT